MLMQSWRYNPRFFFSTASRKNPFLKANGNNLVQFKNSKSCCDNLFRYCVLYSTLAKVLTKILVYVALFSNFEIYAFNSRFR